MLTTWDLQLLGNAAVLAGSNSQPWSQERLTAAWLTQKYSPGSHTDFICFCFVVVVL